jgi:hypothetical protein
MSDTPEPAGDPKVRLNKEYEDPHFHDEDEVALPAEDGEHRPARPAGRRKIIPPPRPRRFHED